jgi:hypothetical protein
MSTLENKIRIVNFNVLDSIFFEVEELLENRWVSRSKSFNTRKECRKVIELIKKGY